MIVTRRVNENEVVQLIALADTADFIRKIPNTPNAISAKFVELVERVMAGDLSFLVDMSAPCLTVQGKPCMESAEDVARFTNKRTAYEAELSLIAKAGSTLKDIQGGLLDADTQQELAKRTFACVDHFSSGYR